MNAQRGKYFEIMEEFGRRIGDDLTPNEYGVTSLVSDGVTISLERPDQSNFIYLHAPVKRLGTDPAGELARAMRQNLFAMPLSGSWLAHDAETNELILCFSARIDHISTDDLIAMVEAMATAARDLDADHTSPDAPSTGDRTVEDLSAHSFSVFRV
jgi:hypothetical protein